MIEFEDFEDLIKKIENNLGNDFNNRFRFIRKELNKSKKLPNRQILTQFDQNKSEWVYNYGGKKEIQYHLFLRDNVLGYGLGINSQRGSFNNDDPAATANLIGASFKQNFKLICKILPNYHFEIGSYDQLGSMKEGEFILFGNTVKVSETNTIKKADFNTIIYDLTEQLKAYRLIFKKNVEMKLNQKNLTNHMGRIMEFEKLLLNKKQIILQGPPGTGKTRLAKEIAHQLIFNKQAASDKEQKVALSSSEQFKIVQFHASYGYEDFVRGISIENIDGNIIYETKNRILGEIASKANRNFLQSNEDLETSYQELFLDQAFDEFVAEIAEETEGDNKYELTDNISIVSIDEDAFRYKGGKGWSENGNRMKFADIKQAFKDGNINRQDVKKNRNLARLANWHSSYYVRVLNDFQKYWDNNLVENEKEDEQSKVDVKNYVLIIDEINRANLSSVLGELIYALEYRGEPVESLYDLKGKGREIVLPDNLFIIGTMNTADRSVGHIDYAIRRRFAFESVLPQDLSGQLESGYAFAKDEFEEVKALFVNDITLGWDNSELKKSIHLSDEFDPKDVCIGHSYFIHKDDEDISQRMTYEIKPILEEYIKDGVLKESDALRTALKEL